MAVTGISGLTADKNMNPITDPNPSDIVEDLKTLPDNVLIEYAKDQTNPNATYALTVLMSRKRAKEALSKEDMPDSTVADDIISDISGAPQTQQGIGGASMFVPEEQKQQYLAQQLMAQAGPQGTQPMDMEGINTPPMTRQQASNTMGLTQIPSNIGNYSGGGIVSFSGEKGSFVSYNQPAINFTTGNDYIVTDPRKRPGLQNVAFNTELTPKEQALKLIEEENQKDRTLHSAPTEEQKTLIEEMKKKYPIPITPSAEEEIVKSTAQLEDDLNQLENEKQIKADELINQQGVDFEQLKDKRSMGDFSEEVKKARRAAGVDDEYLKPIQEDIKSQRELYEKNTREAADLALIEAGLLIAGGTSPYALANLKEAAPAIRNYGVALKDLRGEKREIAKMEMQLKAAEQADKIGEADKALALYSDAQKINRDIDVTKLSEANKVKVAELNIQGDVLKQKIANQGRYRSYEEIILGKLSNDPRYQDKQGKPDYDKIFKAISQSKSTGMSGLSTIYKAASEQYTNLQNTQGRDKYPESGREAYIKNQIAFSQGLDVTSSSGINSLDPLNLGI